MGRQGYAHLAFTALVTTKIVFVTIMQHRVGSLYALRKVVQKANIPRSAEPIQRKTVSFAPPGDLLNQRALQDALYVILERFPIRQALKALTIAHRLRKASMQAIHALHL